MESKEPNSGKSGLLFFCLNISVLDLWTMHGLNVITEYKHKCPYISVIKNIYYCDIILCMCGRFFIAAPVPTGVAIRTSKGRGAQSKLDLDLEVC